MQILYPPAEEGHFLRTIQSYVFAIETRHLLVASQSLEAAEERLVQRRQQLHAQMGLPSDRPLLRVANALVFREPGRATAAAANNSRLADVHVGLPPSGVPGGSVHLIDGSYEYYHYMQVRQPQAAHRSHAVHVYLWLLRASALVKSTEGAGRQGCCLKRMAAPSASTHPVCVSGCPFLIAGYEASTCSTDRRCIMRLFCGPGQA